jgi:hypothetical protein
VATLIHLCAATVLVTCFHFSLSDGFLGGFLRNLSDKYQFAACFAVLIFLGACALVFFNRTYSDILGLTGALLGLPFFLRFEFSNYHFYNSWIALNTPGDPGRGPFNVLTLPRLTIPTVALLPIAGTFSLMRLLPASWRIGHTALRDRGWSAFGISFLALAAWYLTAVTPYRFPVFHRHQLYPNIFILHVEKKGMQFRETRVSVWRDDQLLVSHHDRRFFQYSFSEIVSRGVVPEEIYRRYPSIFDWHAARHNPYPPYVYQRSWNSDHWFVYYDGLARFDLVDVERSQVPPAFLALFTEMESLPFPDTGKSTERDVCLGFCYDPTF